MSNLRLSYLQKVGGWGGGIHPPSPPPPPPRDLRQCGLDISYNYCSCYSWSTIFFASRSGLWLGCSPSCWEWRSGWSPEWSTASSRSFARTQLPRYTTTGWLTGSEFYRDAQAYTLVRNCSYRARAVIVGLHHQGQMFNVTDWGDRNVVFISKQHDLV